MKELFAHAEAGENGVHQVVPDVPAVQLAQGLQAAPAQITGVFRIAVQNDDLILEKIRRRSE